MMQSQGSLVSIMGLVAALVAGPALAETNFPVIGGSGNGSFEDRCPAQQYLIAIQGRAGAWTDQVQIVCEPFWGIPSATKPGEIDFYFPGRDDRYFGPGRGGAGGAPVTNAHCDDEGTVTGLMTYMTDANRQVKFFDLTCRNWNLGFVTKVRFNLSSDGFTANINEHSDAPVFEGCPTGEVGIGIRGRYGQDVNALSLICGSFDTPPPPTAILYPGTLAPPHPAALPPPPPAPQSKPVKITGAGSAGQSAPWPTSPFNGTWTVTADHGPFQLQLMLVRGATIGGVISDGTPAEEGGLRGVVVDATHAQFIIAKDGHGRSGTLNVTLSSDGNSFTADGVLSGVFVNWSGTRKSGSN
jgi:hypothetical protein